MTYHVRMTRHAFFVIALLSLTSAAPARDYYATPDGAGEKSGDAWDSAMDKYALRTLLLETVQPGDRVLLGSGDYGGRIDQVSYLPTLGRGGTKEKPIELIGIDTGRGLPRIVGKWSPKKIKYHAHSWAGISIQRGVGHFRIANFRITSCMHGITTKGAHVGLAIENVSIDTCREAILLQGVDDSAITRCKLTRYTKKGVNFENRCHRIVVTDTLANATGGDASGDWKCEEFPFGFIIQHDGSDAPSGDITYERCVSINNLHDGDPKQYANGDGFVAESTAYGVRYVDCLAANNNDGGWDDKSKAAVLERCIAVGNKRNIRIWNVNGSTDEPTLLIHCVGAHAVKRGARSDFVGLWVRGAVVADRCTFHGNRDHAVSVSGDKPGGKLIARRCLFTTDDASADPAKLVKVENGGTFVDEANVRWTPTSAGVDPPRYRHADPTWLGAPRDALVSEQYKATTGFAIPSE